MVDYNARRYPDIIRKIAKAGHEIALHGYFHDPVNRQTPALFFKEMSLAKKILEDLNEKAIIGFRAPNWSINQSSIWALNILLELGFRYDASMDYSVCRKISGKMFGELKEIPRSSFSFLGVDIPFGGGFFLRAFPYFLTKFLTQRINYRGKRTVVYIHTWEFAMNLPCVRLPLKERLIHSWRLPKTRRVLLAMMHDFNFASIQEIYFSEYLT
ncbi:MAG: hypothetical protein COX96_09310 [Candidatus Omnitrophica bacterium CG_4_10_14_0_2_um_filter_44_9]|nr:MAG: hypothetical protein COY78_04500 [Candidatus Omnitrophica bacterium CG_4_10_14_0_8_um_filter_44_12]PIZ83009.1 MAG: hypothetical protein COX96_09310 [Candidatus Omnitrophica bacterium CG_4_10_14_0_2_um_filter_44_9]